MLWELSISNEEDDKRIIPIFINESFILRPMAGKRLMDVFLDVNSKLVVNHVANVTDEVYDKLEQMSAEFAYDAFVDLKDKRIQKNQERFNKYQYALQLRTEAASHIGIENIRRSRLLKLQKEKEQIEKDFKNSSHIYPEFKLVLLVRLEE